ncbi:hypothetical protein ACNKHK_26560 [Shigella flexneri]
MYFSGDGARRDEHGYYWITGRLDDVLNVSGTVWEQLKSNRRWCRIEDRRSRGGGDSAQY